MDINGLKFWIIDFKKDTTSLRDYIKNKGGKLPAAANINKNNTDVIIYNPNVIYYSKLHKSAVYQKEKNGKVLLTVQELKEKMNDTEFPDIAGLDKTYDLSSDAAKAASVKQIADDLWRYLNGNWELQFNDDFYEFDYCSWVNFKLTDQQKELLINAGFSEEIINKLNNKQVTYDKIVEACGGWGCLHSLVMTFLLIKHFIDPHFECEFRIYRDKWEYRGDYPGMCTHPWEVPPALYWKINKKYKYGFLEVKPYEF